MPWVKCRPAGRGVTREPRRDTVTSVAPDLRIPFRDRAVVTVSSLLAAVAVLLVMLWLLSWFKGWFVNRQAIVLNSSDGLEYLERQRAISSERGQVWLTALGPGGLFHPGRGPQRREWARGWIPVDKAPAPYDAPAPLRWLGIDWKYDVTVDPAAPRRWRRHHISVAVPYWLLVAAAGGGAWAAGRRTRRRRRRERRGECARCGYDLCATPGRCPECGYEPPVDRAAPANAPL